MVSITETIKSENNLTQGTKLDFRLDTISIDSETNIGKAIIETQNNLKRIASKKSQYFKEKRVEGGSKFVKNRSFPPWKLPEITSSEVRASEKI